MASFAIIPSSTRRAADAVHLRHLRHFASRCTRRCQLGDGEPRQDRRVVILAPHRACSANATLDSPDIELNSPWHVVCVSTGMPSFVRAPAALPFLLFFLLSERGGAQAATTITIESGPVRVTRAGAPVTRSPSIASNVVNYDDCIADQSLQFNLALSEPFPLGVFAEAWAGEGTIDCSNPLSRAGAVADCWPVGTVVSLTPTSMRADIRVEDAIAQFGQPVKAPTTHGDVSVCGSLPPGPQVIALQFVAVGGPVAPETNATYSLVAASSIGASRNDFIATAGDGAATITLLSAPDPTSQGYDVYCDPQSKSAGAAGQCSSSTLIPQKGPYGLGAPYPGPPPIPLLCARIAPDATTTAISGLTNGTSYAIAVTERDSYGNHGNLSDLQCVTPRHLAQGTSGSSGGCAMSPARTSTGVVAVVLGFVTLAGARLTRRRRRKA
jgi:hypothetical protein